MGGNEHRPGSSEASILYEGTASAVELAAAAAVDDGDDDADAASAVELAASLVVARSGDYGRFNNTWYPFWERLVEPHRESEIRLVVAPADTTDDRGASAAAAARRVLASSSSSTSVSWSVLRASGGDADGGGDGGTRQLLRSTRLAHGAPLAHTFTEAGARYFVRAELHWIATPPPSSSSFSSSSHPSPSERRLGAAAAATDGVQHAADDDGDEGANLTMTNTNANATTRVAAAAELALVCKYVRRELRRLSEDDRARYLRALAVVHRTSTAEGKAQYGEAFVGVDALLTRHLDKVDHRRHTRGAFDSYS